MKDLIQDWENRKARQHKAHKKFIRKLVQHKSKKFDQYAGSLHDQTFEKIDCLDCANCCTSIPPIVTKTDTQRIAKHLNLKSQDFEQQFLTVDEDGDTVMNQTPCPFLQSDNRCEIYEVRPKACQEYPHTDQFQFSQHLNLHPQNALYCPAVFHMIETMLKNVPV